MTIFVYKGLTRNSEIGNARVWVFPNIWRLGQVRDTKFGTNDKCVYYDMHFSTKFKLNILNIIIFSEHVQVWKKKINSFIHSWEINNVIENATIWVAKIIFGHILRTKIFQKMQFFQNVNRHYYNHSRSIPDKNKDKNTFFIWLNM